MSLTQGNVVITCAGKAPLRFREGTRVSCVLSVAAKAFEPGSFNSADGYAVTPDRPLAAGQYAYNCGKSGRRADGFCDALQSCSCLQVTESLITSAITDGIACTVGG
jgi:hypothetical protein